MKRGLRKWPDVPAAYGWLSLNRRGEWLLEGERVLHRGLIDVINQHYQPDRNGAWYFQNGPQKVFVDLEYTPLVYSLRRARCVTACAGSWSSEQPGA